MNRSQSDKSKLDLEKSLQQYSYQSQHGQRQSRLQKIVLGEFWIAHGQYRNIGTGQPSLVIMILCQLQQIRQTILTRSRLNLNYDYEDKTSWYSYDKKVDCRNSSDAL